MTHWTSLLPEAGTISERGDDIEALAAELRRHEFEIVQLRALIARAEEEAFTAALDAWTEAEIREAQVLAQQQPA